MSFGVIALMVAMSHSVERFRDRHSGYPAMMLRLASSRKASQSVSLPRS
jgi:hypothetical protein